ncbi:Ger(x)C family spore germination protein [Paenibacillus sp. BK720]|uniref:Ger(x)C family spore germination protein n=1 Tax=Paenibacillus sp. BK720 TaxID=2587092 RepID=UPI0014220DCC|nr:Ger(x)C family spore germination protein [Paenibacillus sp. BK720]NIK71741.1 Ger(x)C family germination protein [Paenibacillus sp. BK720]
MRKRVGVAFILLGICLVLTGCWDVKTVSDYNFVTAMGIDHKEGKYTIYVQLMDFGDMGTHDQSPPGDRSNVWIGRSEGESLYEAINKLYKTSQQNLYWDHLMAIVFSENAIKNDINTFFDSIPRFPQIRYNTWVFSTREPISELFKYSTFFNLSPISNLLHNPRVLHNQLSYVPPIRLNTVLANKEEKGETDLIPNLILVKKKWEDTERDQTVLEMNGAFALDDGRAEHFYSEKQLDGVRWVTPKTRRSVLPINKDGRRIGMMSILKPDKKVDFAIEGGKPFIRLELEFKGVIEEVLTGSGAKEFQVIAEKEIREQVVQTYNAGIANATDIYGLEQYLYRRDPKTWKSLTAAAGSTEHGSFLNENSLKDVKVKVNISHSGMYDMDP